MTDQLSSKDEFIFEHARRVLRIGFFISAGLLLIGIIWSVIERTPPGERVLPFRDLPRAIIEGQPSAVIDLGILAMLLTPVALVIAVGWEFFQLNERRYAVVSLLVLGVLCTSIAIALFK